MIHELDVPDGERAHYSKRTIDFEFDYPFGRKELWGLAYRGILICLLMQKLQVNRLNMPAKSGKNHSFLMLLAVVRH